MEVPPATWSTREGFGIDPTHPPHVGGQPDVGQPAHPRRTGQTGTASLDGHDPQVSPKRSTPTLTELADLSAEPCGWHCRHGFLCGPDRDRSSALRAGRHA